jgi:endogenous inhibitor of DNA gyrase (YacG/DUF329 family)
MYQQSPKSEVRHMPEQEHLHKKLCAFLGRGRHYYISDGNSHGPFCSRECQKLDDNAGPNR